MRRLSVLLVVLLLTTSALAEHNECRDADAPPFRLRVLSIAGSEAYMKDVLLLKGACRYIWHGDEGSYSYTSDDSGRSRITFTPDDRNADAPWGGSAIVYDEGRLCFPIGDDQCILVGPKESWWRRLCPIQPIC